MNALTTVLETPTPAETGASESASSSNASKDEDELSIISRAKTGDPAARDLLARRYRQSAYVLALQLTGHREDALDVAQDSLLRFFMNLHRFDHNRPVLPWLRRIVRNSAIDLQRRKKVRRADSLDSSGPEGSALEVVDGRVDTHRSAQTRQRQQVVWACLQTLTPPQREIVVLRDYQDLSYQEIADALGIPMGTVMSRLHRARNELRQRVLHALDGLELGEER